ncbi:MAG TPA: FAD-dependent oxidoreductase [Myxococcaceae bacterium]|nr:FAD-dependent oxidoreductase [Myxococcaceae bacterium]
MMTDDTELLIVGAGVTGLAAAAAAQGRDLMVVEADREMGGYCKTVRREGFVWDYSGHFFHFTRPEIEQWLRERMRGQIIRSIEKKAFVAYRDRWIDFPLQKNIHQLPQAEFIDCLHDLYLAARTPQEQVPGNFKQMLYGRLGRSICEKFLVPYNEKLYACDLSELDPEAMGRFFPSADLDAVIRNMKVPDNGGYNATFTYPEGGAIEYVKALASGLDPERIALGERVERIDLAARVAHTARRQIRYRHLISTMPINRLAEACGLPHRRQAFSWNKVLVFNLGFDRKGPKDVHWLYVPDPALSYYRVGFYDNIFDGDRMSLYVEVGFPSGAPVSIPEVRTRVLADLRTQGLIRDHRLVAEHAVLLDPAYVHITRDSLAEARRLAGVLCEHDAHSVGRYGAWTYCSIEDNIVQARETVAAFSAA